MARRSFDPAKRLSLPRRRRIDTIRSAPASQESRTSAAAATRAPQDAPPLRVGPIRVGARRSGRAQLLDDGARQPHPPGLAAGAQLVGELNARIASRLKVMSNMNISERRIPQDGQITLRLSKHRRIGFRVSTCPTLHGEKIVLRLLNTGMANLSIGALGMNDKQLADYRAAIAKPYGLILVTGPTGSGKTVTQYSALNQLNQPERNILTIEDPIEFVHQSRGCIVNHRELGLHTKSFSAALRGALPPP